MRRCRRYALGFGLALATACSHNDRDGARNTRAATAEVAADPTALERALDAHWRAAGVVPVASADDATLLRRASLDLLGRIPTVAEQDAYAADTDPQKLAHAIDRMLASPEHAAQLADRWTELLLDGALKVPPKVRTGTHEWLASQFAKDVPLDTLAREILTASGELDANGPGGFMLAHGRKGRTVALAGTTARVFLGAQIQCAQCHDHPSESFTQKDFHAFAAHWARTKVRPRREGDGYSLLVVDRRRGEARMPLPTDSPEEPSGPIVAPAYFGQPTTASDRRDALADRILADRRFALEMANRTWAQLFGRGIVEPVDALPLSGEVPPLLDAVADELALHDYDLDALVRAIMLSPAYRLDSRGEGDGSQRVAAFAQSAVRPLPTETLLRALATAATQAEDGELAPVLERRRLALREFRFVFDDDEATTDDDAGDLPRTLLWENGDLTALVASSRPGSPLRKFLREEQDPARRIELLWRRFYARTPTELERATANDYVARHDGDAGYEDLVHALVASSEFTTNH